MTEAICSRFLCQNKGAWRKKKAAASWAKCAKNQAVVNSTNNSLQKRHSAIEGLFSKGKSMAGPPSSFTAALWLPFFCHFFGWWLALALLVLSLTRISKTASQSFSLRHIIVKKLDDVFHCLKFFSSSPQLFLSPLSLPSLPLSVFFHFWL